MSTPEATVAVAATVEAELAPDTFEIVARCAVSRGTAEDAAQALAAGYAALERAVTGLAELRVRHGAIGIWSDSGAKLAWHGQRAMTITGDDLSTVGEVVAAVSAVPTIGVEGPTWSIARDNPVHAELQARSVAEARVRAERYAAAVGGRLGPIVEITDQGAGGAIRRFAMAMAAVSGDTDAPELSTLDLTPQPIELSVTVNARWALLVG